MQSELETIKKELQALEELQLKMDKKIKDAAAYKESNVQLTNIIKTFIISTVIIVVIFCSALVFTFMKSQADLYNLLINGSFETVTTTEEMTADGDGVIFNNIDSSTITQNNSYDDKKK